MIRVRDIRFATSLLVLSLAGAAALIGLTAARFGIAQVRADGDSAASHLKNFVGQAPISGAARRDLLAFAAPDDAVRRAEDIAALLAEEPLSGAAWLDLAAARQASRQAVEQVAAALVLSNLTAPREAHVMAARAAFGLSLWEDLPPNLRRTLVSDLIGGWGEVDVGARRALAAGLAIKGDATREQVRSALLLAGKPAAGLIEALGLAPEVEVAPK